MVAPIGPISIPTITGTTGAAGTAGAAGTPGTDKVDEAGRGGFGRAVGDALTRVGQQEASVEKAAEAAATGNLLSVSDYMVAATEAQLTTQITVAVRDRAISSFNDIMRLQI